jgi:hypothetical protein
MVNNELYSITEIKPEDCYETSGSRPVRVFCNDLNYYVCKYHTGIGFPFALFNEYLAAVFLKKWQLPVPEFAFVNIRKEHVMQTNYPFHYFSTICFGSRFMGECKEVDKLFLETPLLSKTNNSGIETFLKIGLFDIWLCNEDRHFENFNLLYNLKTNAFIPFDHVFCFNSANLNKEPYLISDNESILSSPFLPRFFERTLQPNLNVLRNNIIDDFKISIERCHEDLDDILEQIPVAWEPNIGFLRTRLDFFFTEDWINSCTEHFTRLFFLNTKS